MDCGWFALRAIVRVCAFSPKIKSENTFYLVALVLEVLVFLLLLIGLSSVFVLLLMLSLSMEPTFEPAVQAAKKPSPTPAIIPVLDTLFFLMEISN